MLRFDRATLRLTGEKLSARLALVLGPADRGGILVGFAGGRIARLDVASLDVTPIGSVEGVPYWIGQCAGVAGPVVAYGGVGALPYGWGEPMSATGAFRRWRSGAR